MIYYLAPAELNEFGSWVPVGVIPERSVAVSAYDPEIERIEIAVPADTDEVPIEWEAI